MTTKAKRWLATVGAFCMPSVALLLFYLMPPMVMILCLLAVLMLSASAALAITVWTLPWWKR